MQVFISYASEDRDLAEQVQLAAVGAGHEAFFDRESLPPGGDFHSRIAAAVNRCDVFVFLISPHAVQPGSYALTEMKLARTRWPHPKGRVLPVLATPVPWDQIPNYLKAVTVLEPVGNLPAEVVMELGRLALLQPGADRSGSEPRDQAAQMAAPGMPQSVAPADPPAEPLGTRANPGPVPAQRRGWLLALAGTGAAIAIVWALMPGSQDGGRQSSAPSSTGPAGTAGEAASTPDSRVGGTHPAAGAATALAPPGEAAATGPWAAFRCALAGARNPLAERAAAVAPPDFRVDAARHLLLQRSGEPVSIAPATSLGPLESRRFIVVHFSAGPQQGVEAYFQRADAVASVHVMIARDGSVKQMVPFDFAAHHAGPSRWKGVEGLNRHSIGIDLENWGQLKSREGTWQAWTGATVPAAEVLTTGDPPQHWQRYTDAQLLSFAKVACALRLAYPSIEDIVGHEQVSAGRKNDPGPAFPLQRMQAIVLGPQAAGPR